MKIAKAMLHEKELPKIFQDKVGNTTAYLLNRCPIEALLNITPIETWGERTPFMRHLREFG